MTFDSGGRLQLPDPKDRSDGKIRCVHEAVYALLIRFGTFEQRFIRWTQNDEIQYPLRVVLALAGGALIWVTVSGGVPPIWYALSDTLALFDAGWRIFSGQVPHRDFYSVIGPFPEGILGLGFVLTGGQGIALPLVLALCGLAFSSICWLTLRDRVSEFWRCAAASWMLFLPSSCTALGFSFGPAGLVDESFLGFRHATTYAEIYNRLGWSSLTTLMLIVLIPRRSSGIGEYEMSRFDCFAAGGLVVLCVFSKINFLAAAAGICVWTVVTGFGFVRANFFYFALGVGTMVGVLGIYPGGLMDYFKDQWTMASVHRDASLFDVLQVRLRSNFIWIALLTALHLGVSRSALSAQPLLSKGAFRLAVNGAVAIALSLFTTVFDFEGAELPGLVVVGLLTLEMLRRSDQPKQLGPRNFFGVCAVILFLANYIVFDAGGLCYGLLWNHKHAHEPSRLPGTLLATVHVPVWRGEQLAPSQVNLKITRLANEDSASPLPMSSLEFARWIDDGFLLLGSQSHTTFDRLFVADWFNPFNLALGLPPPRGGALFWDYGRMVDDLTHPPPSEVLRDVTLVMVPKLPYWRAQRDFLVRTYLDRLSTDFAVAGESEFWTLWRKIHRETR